EHAWYAFDWDTKILTIGGTGPMEDYAKLEDDGNWSLWSPPYWAWDTDLSRDESRRQIEHIVMGEGITTIGAGAFRDLDGLESISIASTVTSIGGWAFDKTTAIEEITLPNGLTMIDDSSFSDCNSLRTINIPSGVTSIGPYAFLRTNISEITLPANLTRIDEFAFNDTPLTSITIPAKVQTIGERAFYECTELQDITVNSKNPYLKSVDGVLFTKDGTELICYCPGRTDSFYRVPDGVQVIRASAFSYTESLTEVKLPDSLLTIRDWAFGHTGLTEAPVPQNVQEIEYCAFGACSDLTTATLPAALSTIGKNVFDGCPLETVYYEGSEEEWSSIDIASNETLLAAQIHYSASPYCPHTSTTYHPAVAHTCTADGSIAYWQCDLCGNKFLDDQATRRAGDTVVPAEHNYESAVTTQPTCSETGVRTFTCTVCSAATEGHSYTVTIPATGQHRYVAGRCTNLLRDGVTVCGHVKPDAVTSGNCGVNSSSIITLYLYPGQSLNYNNIYSDNVQWKLDSDGTLHIFGHGSMGSCIQVANANNYGTVLSSFYASPWYDYRSDIRSVIIDHGVTSIGAHCFDNCGNMVSIELPHTLTSIAASSFQNDGSLRDIFYHGTPLEFSSVSNSGLTLTDRELHFLGEATYVADIALPPSLTTIDEQAFAGVTWVTIDVPGTVTQIADDAFEGDVTLIVESGSYAESWARAHRIAYVPQ
ncbi:MAG: leucine-rich repeat domain-containing protein, partial [Clostridiales bacterium]|nr:leucine-rich repeat domain-containing protein [Clostridiales bacterium]